MTQTTINNGDLGLTVRTALNTMFGEIYGELAGGSAFLTGSSTWTVPASSSGFVWVDFAFVTAGGGGGGVSNAAAATASSGNPGWTGTLRLKLASGTVVTYANGAGGTGGAAGANNGNPGGDTTIAIAAGATYTLKGGLGGIGSASGNAATPIPLAAVNTQWAAMTITPTADAFFVVTPCLGSVSSAGATGIGGQARNTIYGLSGVPALNSAGGNATGYGNAGAGAGASVAANLAGGNGTPACMLVSW